ncbi:APC family permease [Sanguibacter antarcticus]|uniref:Amino acid/polyamine/organocation transporter (APC superfamily) n=1 Tax=Sanguibacter antarcticus TaxID=372484 RepID=A0A2A9E816_9MICO|nr:APC family permease [Sanguibacter antarcticus]PFG34310.1 amino acid/polyamine/organocation transporter (APC superfamily) [Sanguibacter antarcticus]
MTVQTDRPPTGDRSTGRPTFRMFDMVLFSVAAMLLLSQLTVTASVGPTAIFWTVVIIVVFFVPYGLVTSELGSAYPDAGGIYAWVVRAFGNRWGSRVSWWYWVNVGLWVPSVYLMFSGAISSMFFGGDLNFWVQVAITVALIWINFWVNVRSLKTGTWVSNLGAGITIVVIIALAIAGGIFASAHGSATSWTMETVIPTNALPAFIAALPIIIYNFLGFELMSSASTQMANPQRDVPKTIGIAGLLIGGFYLVATIGMQVILPAGEISQTTGLVDALRHGFGDSTIANAIVTILGIGALFCFFASLVPWTIGANIAAAEAAQQGDLPKVFARTHPTRGTPVGAAMLCSIVGTVFTVGYAGLFALTDGAIDDLFWNLFAFSSVIFLLPYIVMMLAFAKLRRIDAARPRPYRVPGGTVVTWLITWIPVALLSAAVVFFVWNPYDYSFAVTGSILVGLAVTVGVQEYFCAKSPEWTRQRALERGDDPDSASQFADAHL